MKRENTLRSALLVLDTQVGPFNFPPEVHDADALIARINCVADKFRENGDSVFFIQHCTPAGSPMEKDGPAWQILPTIKRHPTDVCIDKMAGDSFFQTDLEELLRQRGIGDIYVSGYASELCVDSTARRAISLGFTTHLISDCHSTKDRPTMKAAQIIPHQNWVLSNLAMPQNQIRLISSSDLIANYKSA